MSIPALNWALNATTKNAGQKVVLIILANYADESNRAWPAQKTIARQSCMSDRNVRRALTELEELCFVTRTHRYTSEGQRTTDAYLLHVNTTGQNVRKPSLPDKIDTDYRTNCPTEPSVEPPDISITTPYPQKGDVTNGEEKQSERNESKGARQESEDKRLKSQGDKRESKSKRREPKSQVEIPDWLKAEDWQDFKAHRQFIKKAMSPIAEKRMINTLAKLHEEGEDVSEAINQSIIRGWAGVFSVKNKNPAGATTSTPGRAQPQHHKGRTHENYSRPRNRAERCASDWQRNVEALERSLAEEAEAELGGRTVDEASCDLRGEVVRLLPRRHGGHG